MLISKLRLCLVRWWFSLQSSRVKGEEEVLFKECSSTDVAQQMYPKGNSGFYASSFSGKVFWSELLLLFCHFDIVINNSGLEESALWSVSLHWDVWCVWALLIYFLLMYPLRLKRADVSGQNRRIASPRSLKPVAILGSTLLVLWSHANQWALLEFISLYLCTFYVYMCK